MPYQRKTFNTEILKKFLYTVFLIIFVISLFSCGQKSSGYEFERDVNLSKRSDRLFKDSVAESSAGRWEGAGFSPEGPAGAEGQTPASYANTTSTNSKSLQEQTRKKILSGGCTIRTASFAAGILDVSAIAEKYKGWVDSASDNSITIRVPAGNFRKAFDEIVLAKDVVDKYEEADDVTDHYSDLSGRLEVLKKTRLRLQNLLASETDTEKKVFILREIKRIDDQIETIQANLEYLDKAIAYSTITVKFISYSYKMPYDNTKIVFRWVDSLDPFSVTIPEVFRKVVVPLSDDFAVLKERNLRYFHAETADGTILRIGTVKNNPEGDSAFWRKAIIHAIGSRFLEYTEAETGDVKYVLFKPKSNMDYRYLVGAVIKRKLIYVIEVYFPDSASYEKRIDTINKSLGELKIK